MPTFSPCFLPARLSKLLHSPNARRPVGTLRTHSTPCERRPCIVTGTVLGCLLRRSASTLQNGSFTLISRPRWTTLGDHLAGQSCQVSRGEMGRPWLTGGGGYGILELTFSTPPNQAQTLLPLREGSRLLHPQISPVLRDQFVSPHQVFGKSPG